jgi:hypothetical protein
MAYTEQPMKKTLWQKFLDDRQKYLGDIFGSILALGIFLMILLAILFLFVEGIKEFDHFLAPIILLIVTVLFVSYLESESEGSGLIFFGLIYFIISCYFLFFSSSERPFEHKGEVHDPRVNEEMVHLDSIWKTNGIRYYKNDFEKKKVFPKTDDSKSIVLSVSLEYDFKKSGIPVDKMKGIETAISTFFESKDTLDMKVQFVTHMKDIVAGSSVKGWIENFDTKPYRRNFRDALNEKANEIGVFVRKVNVYIDIKEDD